MNLIKCSTGTTIGVCRHVVIDILRGRPSVEDLDSIDLETRKVAKQYCEPPAVMNIIEAKATMPTAEQRKVFVARMQALEDETKATSIMVVESRGFGASAVRAVLAGIAFLRGRAQKVFPSVDDALADLASNVPEAERVAFLDDLRKTIEAVRKA